MKYAVYVPAGPKVNPDFLADTILSALHFMGSDTLVFIGEDGSKGRYDALTSLGPNIHVRQVPAIDDVPHTYTVYGKFFLKKARIQREIVRDFQFDRLLNLDDDALLLNGKFMEIGEKLLANRRKPGILARYSLNHEFQPLPYEGQLESMYMQMSRNPLRSRGKIPLMIQPKLRKVMRPVLTQAMDNGYTLGTSFIGGSWLITRDCLEAIVNRPEVDSDVIKHSPCADDDLFTIFAYACGFRVYDYLSDPAIFQIEWRKLSMSPQELHDQGVSVIHSVRDPEFGGEEKIRAFFRQRREGQ
jgi:hypothetical protein